MKVAVIDTYYPGFLSTLKDRTAPYDDALKWTMERRFGTFDAYSRHLRMLGWEAIDIIANDAHLQGMWAKEHGFEGTGLPSIALLQIAEFEPDVVFCQDLSFFSAANLEYLRNHYVLAGQCSCPFPAKANVEKFDVLFTSFPHYVEAFEKLGVRGEFLPLAFDPLILERTMIPPFRTLVSFVGGYGRHWKSDELFVTLAEQTPIQFWGYGFQDAPEPVRKRWRGPAWGMDMYDIYLQSHIVINRHGGVAQGYANNLRMFEATGCGAMLLTEYAPNLADYFSADECATYVSPRDAADRINHYLARPSEMLAIASAGQRRTVENHTYFHRMPKVSKALQECLVAKRASC